MALLQRLVNQVNVTMDTKTYVKLTTLHSNFNGTCSLKTIAARKSNKSYKIENYLSW